MNIAEFSIQKNVVVWALILLFLFGGIFAYLQLARYEDPEFTIKDAKVVTLYPGATPYEVEEEVTDLIEQAAQQLGQIKRTTSLSKAGFSEVTVTIKDKYTKNDLPQIWDELRRKVNDVQRQLPPGAGPSIVYDDFGDVYGMLYAITGEGFNYRELKKASDLIKRELELVPGVAKVQITGIWQEAIFVDVSRSRMTQLGIALEEIYQILASQNLVADAGHVRVGDEYIVIRPTGDIASVESISNLLIPSTTTSSLIYLSDIASVSRGYVEVPQHLVFYNGEAALSMGVSIVSGGNVVKIGEAIEKQLSALASIIPVGIQVHPIYEQPVVVDASVKNFLVNLIEALVIVIAVLLLFMGVRSGMIIAAILLLTVMGTLFFMYVFNIALERISLGALVIALGMLVDNAIVIAEGILVKVQQGVGKMRASKEVVQKNMWPLFGATIIGILAFAPIGLSQDSTGEYTASLFYVIMISLLLSWVLAITVASLLCYGFLKEATPEEDSKQTAMYQGVFYQRYQQGLMFCLHRRKLTLFTMLGLLILSAIAFTFLKEGFFPNSTTPMFLLDYWRAEGTDIRATAHDMQAIEAHLREMEGIEEVTSLVGQGAQRFMLVYEPESPNSSYGQFLVSVKDYRNIDAIAEKTREFLSINYPNAELKIRKIRLGPGKGSKIEARFSGPDPRMLRQLSNEAQTILRANPYAEDVRDDWRQQVKVIAPIYSEDQGRLTGISRSDLKDALLTGFSGKQVGIYRERDELIPIISRPPDEERLNVSSVVDLHVWSPLLRKTVPMTQLVSDIETHWEDAIVRRRNRKRTITASAEPILTQEASVVFTAVRNDIEAIPLSPGYQLAWGGEYESAKDAQAALAKQMPIGFLGMFIILVILFNALRQPIIIWLCVPLSLIGVTAGLFFTGKAFDFMALLGFLSLIGMLIKNAIVLVDEIDLQRDQGKCLMPAIVDSSLSRLRPVVLAALTTVLGMLPLLQDAFFVSMAIVIMVGLSFATVLTLLIVPVLYYVFFQKQDKLSSV